MPSLVENVPVVLKKKTLNEFLLFCNISTLRRAWPFIWKKKLESSSPNDSLCRFGWNWPSGAGVEDFLKFSMYFNYFKHYLIFEKGLALHLNNLELPSPKDALCQVWLKLAQWFWRMPRRFLKFVNFFLLFPNYLPFWMGRVLHLNTLESPSRRDILCQVAQWFCRRRF